MRNESPAIKSMEIAIMRHGEPEIPKLPDKVSSKEFFQCLEIYKDCGLLQGSCPHETALAQLRDVKAIVASDLKRSSQSAAQLAAGQPLIIDPLFREIDASVFPIPIVKLSPKTWGNIYIALWLAGVFEFIQSFRDGKKRARDCANKLVSLAAKHDKVLFVGHGFINTYIANELRSRGWKGPKLPGKGYWDYGTYYKSPPL